LDFDTQWHKDTVEFRVYVLVALIFGNHADDFEVVECSLDVRCVCGYVLLKLLCCVGTCYNPSGTTKLGIELPPKKKWRTILS